jgi:hypothetical protein
MRKWRGVLASLLVAQSASAVGVGVGECVWPCAVGTPIPYTACGTADTSTVTRIPSESCEIQLTDGSFDGIQSTDVRNVTYYNGKYYYIYGALAEGTTTPFTNVYVNSYDRDTQTLGTQIQAFDRGGPTATGGGVHDLPAIGIYGSTLVMLNPDSDATTDGFDSDGTGGTASCVDNNLVSPPYTRTAPLVTFTNTATWTPTTSTPAGQNMCLTSSYNFGALTGATSVFQDDQVLELINGGMIIHWEVGSLDGTSHGVSRAFTRISPAGVYTGPYALINGGLYDSTGCPSGSSIQNIFAKTAIRERVINGVTTLYAVWIPRVNFNSSSNGAWQVFAAMSVDGGATWTDLAGLHPWIPDATQNTAIDSTNANYLVYTGSDLNHSAQFDVDSGGKLHILVRYLTSGDQTYCNGHADISDANSTYGLEMLNQTTAGNTAFTASVIDTAQDWQVYIPFNFIDANDNDWVFRPAASTFSNPSTKMAYTVSTNGGASFQSPWIAMVQNIETGAGGAGGNSLSPWRDPHRRSLGMTYFNSGTKELFLKWFDFFSSALPNGASR